MVETVAGKSTYPDRNANLDERFSDPNKMVINKAGTIFVLDGDKKWRRVDVNGSVTLTDMSPSALIYDNQGTPLLLAGNGVLKVAAGNQVVPFAGKSDRRGYADGKGTKAKFSNPDNFVVDIEGNVYVTESDAYCIRKISPDGTVTTLAGDHDISGTADGQAKDARFKKLKSITVTPDKTVYVIDEDVIRAISSDGVVTTIGGKRADGTPKAPDSFDRAPIALAKAKFNQPTCITANSKGDLFIADGTEIRVVKVTHSEAR